MVQSYAFSKRWSPPRRSTKWRVNASGAKLLSVALRLLPERRSFTVVCQNLKRAGGPTADEDTSSSIVIDEKVTVNMRLGMGYRFTDPFPD